MVLFLFTFLFDVEFCDEITFDPLRYVLYSLCLRGSNS